MLHVLTAVLVLLAAKCNSAFHSLHSRLQKLTDKHIFSQHGPTKCQGLKSRCPDLYTPAFSTLTFLMRTLGSFASGECQPRWAGNQSRELVILFYAAVHREMPLALYN